MSVDARRQGVHPLHGDRVDRQRVIKKGGKRGSARVRGTPDDGSPAITIKITFDGSVTRIDGNEVIVERSDLC